MRECEADLVNLFLLTREGEGEAQRKSLPLQVSGHKEVPEAGCDVVEQLQEVRKQRKHTHCYQLTVERLI